MIILITCEGKINGRKQTVVSHGIDLETGNNVVLPNDSLSYFPCYYNEELMEWVLKEETDKEKHERNIKNAYKDGL